MNTMNVSAPSSAIPWARAGVLVLAMSLALMLARCSSPPSPEVQRAAAATTYAGMLADCLAEAKASMPDRSEASRVAARARYDFCRANVVALWTPADAGEEGGAR